MDDRPLDILPFGRTLDDEAKLERKKAQGHAGMRGCLWIAGVFAMVAVFAAGWIYGRLGFS